MSLESGGGPLVTQVTAGHHTGHDEALTRPDEMTLQGPSDTKVYTHTGLVGDAALLVVAGVTAPLLGGPVVRHEGCVTLLTELVLTHDLVLPHSLRHLMSGSG